MGNIDKLYDEYIQENKGTFVEFYMVDIKRSGDIILYFKGKDTEGNEIEVISDSSIYKMGGGNIYCNEEFTLKELGFLNEEPRGEIHIKPRGNNYYVNIWDWL